MRRMRAVRKEFMVCAHEIGRAYCREQGTQTIPIDDEVGDGIDGRADSSDSGSDIHLSSDDDCDITDVALRMGAPGPDLPGRNVDLSLPAELYMFMTMACLSYRVMERLLKILVRHGVEVPGSVYLLCKDRISMSISGQISNNYYYWSILANLKYLVAKGLLPMENGLKLQIKFYCDGYPLHEATRSKDCWPVYMSIANPGICSKLLPVAVYLGWGKPPLLPYVALLCNELRQLQDTGAPLSPSVTVFVSGVVFICDAQGRAFLQDITYHSGALGCGYCRIEGQYVSRRTVFGYQEVLIPRTGENYRLGLENNQRCEALNGQARRVSPLADVCDLRDSFPVDYMHCCCLGIMKKLLGIFCGDKEGLRLPCRLAESQMSRISEAIRKMRSRIPAEFQRRLRILAERKDYKATEYRQIILYFGPVIFKGVLPPAYYEHFIQFHFAMYVLCSERCTHLIDHAEALINRFAHSISTLYGECHQSYNIHTFRHLPDHARLYGPVDKFAAWPCESLLGQTKLRVSPTRFAFPHLLNRMNVLRELSILSVPCRVKYTAKPPNNFAMLGNKAIMQIEKIVSEDGVTFVAGYQMQFERSLYSFDYHCSANLGIGYYTVTTKYIAFSEPKLKCIAYPTANNIYIVFPCVSDEIHCSG